MSGQSSQKLRRMASPSTTKQGPMKATQSFGLMQGSPTASRSSNGRKSSPSSPTCPAWPAGKSRKSPDLRSSPERGSPSSPQYGSKEKGKGNIRTGLSPGSQAMKRAGSLDSMHVTYLKGEWPRDPPTTAQQCCGACDKATQTPEEWDELLDKKKRASHKIPPAVNNGDTLREIKASLAKHRNLGKEGSRCMSSGVPRTSPVQGKHNALSANTSVQTKNVTIPLQAPVKLSTRMRGSVEGLNQEIERLTFTNTACTGIESGEVNQGQIQSLDGHRAPIIVEMMVGRTCSVDTQTPSGYGEESRTVDSSSSSSSSRSQSESPSIPIIPSLNCDKEGKENDEQEDKEQESPEPKPKSFSKFVREPPDGCERVNLKVEEPRREAPPLKETLFCPIVKPSGFHIPSQQSAFSKCPLLKPYVNQPSEMALKTSKSAQDLGAVAAN